MFTLWQTYYRQSITYFLWVATAVKSWRQLDGDLLKHSDRLWQPLAIVTTLPAAAGSLRVRCFDKGLSHPLENFQDVYNKPVAQCLEICPKHVPKQATMLAVALKNPCTGTVFTDPTQQTLH